jgi:glutathione peroxidase-family protein
MKAHILFYIVAIVAVALIVGYAVLSGQRPTGGATAAGQDDKADPPARDKDTPSTATADTTATIGKRAPDFTLPDPDGQEHALSDYAGKYVVLEWINFDCPFVRAHYESGRMPKLQRTYIGKGVVWLSICSSAHGKQGDYHGEALADGLEQTHWSGTAYLVDQDGAVGRTYAAKTTPHMFVINPDGLLIYAGAIDDKPTVRKSDAANATNYVVLALDAAMAGKEVETKTTKSYGCSVKY